jgi:hypothetical protein
MATTKDPIKTRKNGTFYCRPALYSGGHRAHYFSEKSVLFAGIMCFFVCSRIDSVTLIRH